jgi:hypothetical protein
MPYLFSCTYVRGIYITYEYYDIKHSHMSYIILRPTYLYIHMGNFIHHAQEDLESKIAFAMSSRNLSMERSLEYGHDVSDAFLYLQGMVGTYSGLRSHLRKYLSS